MKKKFFLSKDDVKEVKKSLSNIENTALRTNAVVVSDMSEQGGDDSTSVWYMAETNWMKAIGGNTKKRDRRKRI